MINYTGYVNMIVEEQKTAIAAVFYINEMSRYMGVSTL
jgi:hypothetical protein